MTSKFLGWKTTSRFFSLMLENNVLYYKLFKKIKLWKTTSNFVKSFFSSAWIYLLMLESNVLNYKLFLKKMIFWKTTSNVISQRFWLEAFKTMKFWKLTYTISGRKTTLNLKKSFYKSAWLYLLMLRENIFLKKLF